MKLKLNIKKINSQDISKDEKFNIHNNTFNTYIKKTNYFNKNYIYTNFQQNIENINNFSNEYISVKAMVIDNIGRLYIGGSFNKIGNLSCNNIAMWDGKKWNSLEDGINGQVISLCIDKYNNLFVGGSFDGANNNSIKSKNIIMWNSYNKKWIGLDGGVNGYVSSIKKLSNSNIVIAGDFTNSINSLTYLEKIAYWNNISWNNLGEDFLIDKSVFAIDIDTHDNIYIGGPYFPASVYDWNNQKWNKLVDNDSNDLTQIINTIVINPITSNPVFGGTIQNFGSYTNVFNVIEFDVTNKTWNPLTNTDGFGLDSQCLSLFYNKTNNQLYAGGIFYKLTNGIEDGLILNHIAVWNGIEWKNVGNGVNGNYVESFEFNQNNELFIGGFIFGSKNVWSNGLVIYTNNYINLFFKEKLLYILTNFNKSITISVNECLTYIYNKVID
jgi:hypothetical protein